MSPIRLVLFLADPAAAQPLANPASFGSGTALGGAALGALIGGLIFYACKTKGEELRWRRNRPFLGRALVAAGAVAGAAVFYIFVFRL